MRHNPTLEELEQRLEDIDLLAKVGGRTWSRKLGGEQVVEEVRFKLVSKNDDFGWVQKIKEEI